ncbi:MAG: alpha/beta fold hydrolase [Anaerolineae bacterium]
MRKLFLAFTILLLVMAFRPALAQDASFEPTDCWFDDVPGQDPECGWLTVPADHNNPDNGETIQLAVAVFHATGDDPAPDPVVYLEGGPGGSPLEFISLTFDSLFSAFAEQRDVIVFDQRGVGYSQPALDCSEIVDMTYETLDENLSIDESNQMTLDAYQQCHDRLTGEGIDLSLFNSAQNAADVAMIGPALGYDEVNLYGISYGTRLALTVMRDHPEGIRSVIIDSVYPPQETLFNATNNFNRALQTLFAGCAADDACNEAFPDLESVFNDTYEALQANPAELDVVDASRPGRTLPALLNGDSFVGLVFQSLYSAELIPSLPKAIYDASQGNYSYFGTMLTLLLYQIDVISNGMYNSVECAEEVPFSTPDEVAALNTDLPAELQSQADGVGFGESTFALCDIWDVTAAPAVENEAVTSELPTLVMAGEYDPITPPDWGRAAAASLPNSTFFLVPAVGHGAIPSSECATGIALAFFDDPEASPDGACLLDAPGVDFVIPGEALTLAPFSNEEVGISSVAPEGWDESVQNAGGLTVLAYARGTDAALVFLVLPLDLNTFMQSIALQAGGELPDPQIVETDNATWSIYQLELMGQSAAIAVAEIDGLTYAMQLTAPSSEMEDLTTQVLVPAIEALVPLE